MPIRLLREGILSSDRIDQLDPPAEVFYRRLMSKVDDFGLFDARLSMLRSSLYPLRVDRVREADIARWIAACEMAGVIALYQHDGKPFLQMLDTGWQTRSEPKYPLPPWGKGEPKKGSANNCSQPLSVVPVVVVGDVVEDEGGNARKRATPTRTAKARKTQIPHGFCISEGVKAWAADKGFDRIPEHLEAFVRKSKAKGYEYIDWDLAFMEAVREDWAKLRGRGQNGGAPAGEFTTTGSKAVESTKARLAAIDERNAEVAATSPEQRAAVAARLAAARAAITTRETA